MTCSLLGPMENPEAKAPTQISAIGTKAVVQRRGDEHRLMPSGQAQAGLSLVEVLVALSIVALATTIITLTLSGPPPHARESERLQATLEQIASNSLVTGRPAAILVDGRTYAAAIWQDGAWRTVPGASRTLPAGIVLTAASGDQPGQLENQPIFVFDPLGHSSLAELDLVRGAAVTRFSALPDGRIVRETPDVR